jgi:hypothetical protein
MAALASKVVESTPIRFAFDETGLRQPLQRPAEDSLVGFAVDQRLVREMVT